MQEETKLLTPCQVTVDPLKPDRAHAHTRTYTYTPAHTHADLSHFLLRATGSTYRRQFKRIHGGTSRVPRFIRFIIQHLNRRRDKDCLPSVSQSVSHLQAFRLLFLFFLGSDVFSGLVCAGTRNKNWCRDKKRYLPPALFSAAVCFNY